MQGYVKISPPDIGVDMLDDAESGEHTSKRTNKNHELSPAPVGNLNRAIIKEMELQCDLALKGFEELERSLKEHDEEKIWYSIHSFFSAAARISELLKLGEKTMEKHGYSDDLKELISVPNVSYLSHSKLESTFSSFGEDLKKWAIKPERTHIGERNVIAKGCVSGMEEENMLRHFDPESYEFTVRGKTYELKRYHEIILEVKDVIENLARRSFWEI